MRLASDTRECGTCKSYKCTCAEDHVAKQIRRAGQGFMALVIGGVLLGLLYIVLSEWPAFLGLMAVVGLCWGIGYLIDACWPWWKDKK